VSKQILNRADLYEKVWAEPMSRLAPQYGLSDKGLAKICDRMDIPIPYRGYWAKKAAGKKPPKNPLPTKGANTTSEYHLDSYSIVSKPSSEDSLSPSDIDLDFIKRIKFEEFYSEYHPLVEATREYFLSKKHESDSPILKPSGNILEIETSEENLERALRIAEAVIRGVQQIGGTVELGAHKYNEHHICSYAIIHGEKLAFSIKEQVGQVKHVPTEEELKRMKKNEFYHPPSYDNAPSNQFILEIETWTHKGGLQKKWMDKPDNSLDNKFGSFLVGLLRTAPIVRQERLEYEEKQRKEQEEKERVRLEQEKRDADHKRLAALNSHLKMHAKVDSINKYLHDLEKVLKEETQPEVQLEEINRWIEWVKNYRDNINPLNPKNLLFEHHVPVELYQQQQTQRSSGYVQWAQPEQKKERSWGWWDRPVWKW